MQTKMSKRRIIQLLVISAIVLSTIYYRVNPSRRKKHDVNLELQRNMNNFAIHPISAFADPRTESSITVLAVIDKATLNFSISCHFFVNEDLIESFKLPREPTPIVDWNMNFVGHLFLCDVKPMLHRSSITAVSISVDKELPGRRISVITIPRLQRNDHSIVACMAPLFGHRYQRPHFVAWIEMNRLLGVRHFVFYNYSIDVTLKPTFNYYIKQGLVTVLPWQLKEIPMSKTGQFPPERSKLHYYGQLEAMNDCLYRYTNRYHYIMFIDLDEIIFPYQHSRIDLLLKSQSQTSIGEFIFWMNYLRSDLPKENTTRNLSLVKDHHVPFLERTVLENRVLYELKQKAIVVGHKMKRMSVHRRVEFWDNSRTKFIDVNLARLLHYTDPPPYLVKKGLGGWRDTRLLKRFDSLISATNSVLSRVKSNP